MSMRFLPSCMGLAVTPTSCILAANLLQRTCTAYCRELAQPELSETAPLHMANYQVTNKLPCTLL